MKKPVVKKTVEVVAEEKIEITYKLRVEQVYVLTKTEVRKTGQKQYAGFSTVGTFSGPGNAREIARALRKQTGGKLILEAGFSAHLPKE